MKQQYLLLWFVTATLIIGCTSTQEVVQKEKKQWEQDQKVTTQKLLLSEKAKWEVVQKKTNQDLLQQEKEKWEAASLKAKQELIEKEKKQWVKKQKIATKQLLQKEAEKQKKMEMKYLREYAAALWMIVASNDFGSMKFDKKQLLTNMTTSLNQKNYSMKLLKKQTEVVSIFLRKSGVMYKGGSCCGENTPV